MGKKRKGISINIIRADGTVEELVEFKLLPSPYYDIVFAGSEIIMYPGNEMEISCELDIIHSENMREVARITDRWAFSTGPMAEETRFTLTRIIKIGDEAWFDFSNDPPEPNIPASAMKAIKVRS